MIDPDNRQLTADNPEQLIRMARQRLTCDSLDKNWAHTVGKGKIKGSAVLFLLTIYQPRPDLPAEPCLLLNKRSERVLQPGDLCCPGGGVARVDRLLAPLARWLLPPLSRWPNWSHWRTRHPRRTKSLALLLTTALREGFEEMRLNPLKVQFLGPLPVQKLIMFKRLIYPLAAWVPPGQRLKPNWEVERIVRIPLKRLFEPGNYARYRLRLGTDQQSTLRDEDFPCFIHQRRNGQEVLWGATYRIVQDFLRLVFGFEQPDLTHAPVLEKKLEADYLNGSVVAEKY